MHLNKHAGHYLHHTVHQGKIGSALCLVRICGQYVVQSRPNPCHTCHTIVDTPPVHIVHSVHCALSAGPCTGVTPPFSVPPVYTVHCASFVGFVNEP